MLINDFERWKALKIAQTSEGEMVKCPDCCGGGVIEKECDCCGHESERTCGCCDGEGTLRFGDLSCKDIARVFTRAAYHQEVIADLERLAEWKRTGRISTLVENGYTVYTSVLSRVEKTVPNPATDI